jgi:hypothetical protein
MNNVFSKLSFLLLCLTLALVACNKENIDEIIPEDPEYTPPVVEINNLVTALQSNPAGGQSLGCVTIIYPFKLEKDSGSEITITSNDDMEQALSPVNNLDPVVDFVFPLAIYDHQGEWKEVENNVTLGRDFASCVPETGWNLSVTEDDIIPAFLFTDLCFNLVYPVDLTDLEGNAYTVNNEEELIDLFATVPDVFFALPITVLDEEGNEVIIEDDDAFFSIVEDCLGVNIAPPIILDAGIQIEGFGCYKLEFPFTLGLDDDSPLEIADADAYFAFLMDAEGEFELLYPFSLLSFIDGSIIEITNDDDLIAALEPCGIIITIEEQSCENNTTPANILLFFNQQAGYIGCGYTIDFPLQVEAEGVTYDINEYADYLTVYNMYAFQVDQINLIYPLTVTIVEDGSTLTFNNDDEICEFIYACE